jgi:hypothetical protein
MLSTKKLAAFFIHAEANGFQNKIKPFPLILNINFAAKASCDK